MNGGIMRLDVTSLAITRMPRCRNVRMMVRRFSLKRPSTRSSSPEPDTTVAPRETCFIRFRSPSCGARPNEASPSCGEPDDPERAGAVLQFREERESLLQPWGADAVGAVKLVVPEV